MEAFNVKNRTQKLEEDGGGSVVGNPAGSRRGSAFRFEPNARIVAKLGREWLSEAGIGPHKDPRLVTPRNPSDMPSSIGGKSLKMSVSLLIISINDKCLLL